MERRFLLVDASVLPAIFLPILYLPLAERLAGLMGRLF